MSALRENKPAAIVQRFETGPGVQGQVDWSPYTIDFTCEGRRQVNLFGCVLSYSRYQYLRFTERQDMETTLRQHVRAFGYFQGVAATYLYDNMKTVVMRIEDGEPMTLVASVETRPQIELGELGELQLPEGSTDPSDEEVEAAMKRILAGTGRRGHCVVADLYNRGDTMKLAKEALEVMGRVDIIINNAGTNIVNPVDKIVDEDWDRLLELNLTAPMILVRELAGQMKERNWGRVVNISSIFGLCAKEERGSYSATKSGLIGITRTMAQELAPWGITANAIAPGPISTPLTDRLVQGELRAYFDSMMPLGRWGTPEDLVGPLHE